MRAQFENASLAFLAFSVTIKARSTLQVRVKLGITVSLDQIRQPQRPRGPRFRHPPFPLADDALKEDIVQREAVRRHRVLQARIAVLSVQPM